MNIKRLLLAILAGWVLIFAMDMAIHHFWLGPDYAATKSIWRQEAEMQPRLHWMFIAQLLGVATFVTVWAKGFAGGSIETGAVFGLLMGLFQSIWVLANYVMIPLPGDLAIKWFIGGLVQAVLLGIVTSLVYQPAAPTGAWHKRDSKKEIAPSLTPEQQKKLQELKQKHIRILKHHGFAPSPDSPSPSP